MRLIALTMMILFHLLAISGCAGVPVRTHAIEEGFVKEAEGKSLFGKSKDIDVEKYGQTDWKFEYQNQEYLFYT